jgi:hypothetical protein
MIIANGDQFFITVIKSLLQQGPKELKANALLINRKALGLASF